MFPIVSFANTTLSNCYAFINYQAFFSIPLKLFKRLFRPFSQFNSVTSRNNKASIKFIIYFSMPRSIKFSTLWSRSDTLLFRKHSNTVNAHAGTFHNQMLELALESEVTLASTFFKREPNKRPENGQKIASN